jgi:hypothetical protein
LNGIISLPNSIAENKHEQPTGSLGVDRTKLQNSLISPPLCFSSHTTNFPFNLVPRALPVWDWLFDSAYSPLARVPDSGLNGFRNAATGERVNWREVKELSTLICTALTREYGLREGDTVALFSPNSVWYPVVMFGCLRAGEFCGLEAAASLG